MDSNLLILENVINLNRLKEYDTKIKKYIDKKLLSSSGGVTDQEVETAITEILAELNK